MADGSFDKWINSTTPFRILDPKGEDQNTGLFDIWLIAPPTELTTYSSSIHELTANSVVTGAPVLGTPKLNEVVVDLTATALVTGAPVLGTPVLAQPQFARPSSDISSGNWTPSTGIDLYAMLDEATPSDTDFVRSGNSPVADTCEVLLSTVVDPVQSTDYIVRYRIRKQGAATVSLTFYLMEGVTQRATWTESALPEAETTYEHALSGAEIDSISDHSNIRLRWEANYA